MLLRAATSAMGTRFELVLLGRPETHLRAVADEIIFEILRLHARFSRFEPSSIISHINRSAQAPTPLPVRIDSETFHLLALAESVNAASRGTFAITRPHDALHPPHSLHLDPLASTITLPPLAALDLGAIAKGFALDCAAHLLAEHDIPAALIHAGGSSILARGVPPDSRHQGWPIAIDTTPPFPASRRSLILRDQCLSVSATYPRWFAPSSEDLTHAHILDPRTHQPVHHSRTAACLLPISPDHPHSSALADAWSTAALVLGDELFDLPAQNLPESATFLMHAERSAWRDLAPDRSPDAYPLLTLT